MPSYPAAVENAMTLASADPNYNPAQVLSSVGQLSLAKKRWMDEFQAGQSRWNKEFGLKEKELSQRTEEFNKTLALKTKDLDERIKEAAYQRGYGMFQSGAGSPEERASFMSSYNMPFTEEGKVKIPGYGYAYGSEGLDWMSSQARLNAGSVNTGTGGGGGGGFNSSAALKELATLQNIMPGYAFSARSRLGPEWQIYSSLQERSKNLANTLSRASVPGW